MIWVGTMNWASTIATGDFHCPTCASQQAYRLKSTRPFLTVYFIPVIPIGGLQEYVVCRGCKQSFEPDVLSMATPSASNNPSVAVVPFELDLLRSIALIMVDDGHVSEDEIRIARRVYENMTESNLSREELGRACSEVQAMRLTTPAYLAVCQSRLDHNQKLLIVQAMFAVAGADGTISPTRLQSLTRSQVLLGLPQSEFEMAVNLASQWLGS